MISLIHLMCYIAIHKRLQHDFHVFPDTSGTSDLLVSIISLFEFEVVRMRADVQYSILEAYTRLLYHLGLLYPQKCVWWRPAVWDEMRWDEMRWDEMRWDAMRWNEMRWDVKGWDEMRCNEMRWDEMRCNEMRWWDVTRRCDVVRCDVVSYDMMRCDVTCCDKMICDAMWYVMWSDDVMWNVIKMW